MSEDSIDLSAQSRGRATANAAGTDSGGRLTPSPGAIRGITELTAGKYHGQQLVFHIQV
jgi:hypothetical protein